MDLWASTNGALANLTAPAVLFFLLGLTAGLGRSDLSLPDQAAKTLALYLMLCIGFKGGVEARSAGLEPQFLVLAVVGVCFSFFVPFIAFGILKLATRLDRSTAAAVAAHYGSVSVVTFAAGSQYLTAIGVAFDGYMAAVLALMETPAILAALIILGKPRSEASRTHSQQELLREVFLNGATIMLAGSFLVGLISGDSGMAKLEIFVGPLFQGALCLFLLDMGLVAARQLLQSNRLQVSLVVLAIALPLSLGVLAILIGRLMGIDFGNAVLFAVLAASASYIAAPAAMRIAAPKADAGTYLTMSLGMTFPFNLLLGIPLYQSIASSLWR